MKLLDGIYKDDPVTLNDLVSYIISPLSDLPDDKRDYGLALKVASRANLLAAGKDGKILRNLALAYFKTGDPVRAVQFQQSTMELLGGRDEEMNKQLDRYRQAAIRSNR